MHDGRNEDVPPESCRVILWLQEGTWQNAPWLDSREFTNITEWTDEKVQYKIWDLE